MIRKCASLCAVFAFSFALFAQDKDPVRDKLVAAKSAYDAELKSARQQTEDWFDKREDEARKVGDKKAVDQIKAERAEFEDSGELPNGAPTELKAKRDKALRALESAYAQAVKDYTRAKKDTEAAATEAELKNISAKLNAINLLAMVNPKTCALAGEWKKEASRLTADKGARLQLPYEPGQEYDLSVTCRRETGTEGLAIGLVAGGHQVFAIVDGWPMSGFISGLDLVDKKDASNNVTTVKGEFLRAGQDNIVLCSVRSKKIEVVINGTRVISFTGDFARCSLTESYAGRSKKALLLAFGPDTTFRIDRITLVPIKGRGIVLK